MFMKLFFSILFIALFHITKCQSLEVNAGQDSVLCLPNFSEDSIVIGGAPAAIGGVGNYSYSWDIYPKPYIPFSNAPLIQIWASDMISDTTAANPYLLSLAENSNGPIKLILTVTDSIGTIEKDTSIYYSTSLSTTLGNIMLQTYPGDTAQIQPIGFGGGIPPYTFDWGSSPDLIGDRYDFLVGLDSIPTREVIIPESDSLLHYSLTVTDSIGCQFNIGTYQIFDVLNLSIDKFNTPDIEIYPNPFHNKVIVNTSNVGSSTIHISDEAGRIVHSQSFLQNTASSINLSKLKQGLYVVEIKTKNRTYYQKIIKK